jgi:DNA (cytosine-5)-methyltransferase 1
MSSQDLTFYEFFAGGGMARLGLGRRWQCLFANDCCEKKARAYRANFNGAPELLVRDIRKLATGVMPGSPLLVWASFPCQDLSLAGNGVGLKGERSGTFWAFWRLMRGLAREGRAAPVIVLENVVGAITSNEGRDFRSIIEAIASAGYSVGALVMNAVHFVPQSRPRLFIVAVRQGAAIPDRLRADLPGEPWHPGALRAAHARFPKALVKSWIWWEIAVPCLKRGDLSEVIETNPTGVGWHTEEETERLLGMMSRANLRKVEQASRLGKCVIGTIYRRTRPGEDGRRAQRAEVRFDQVSGCLRTPVGGSSRQTILVVNGDSIRSRLLSPREAARLMGVTDSYVLPDSYNEAYHLMGDGLAVPVVSWLEANLLHPLALSGMRAREAA